MTLETRGKQIGAIAGGITGAILIIGFFTSTGDHVRAMFNAPHAVQSNAVDLDSAEVRFDREMSRLKTRVTRIIVDRRAAACADRGLRPGDETECPLYDDLTEDEVIALFVDQVVAP